MRPLSNRQPPQASLLVRVGAIGTRRSASPHAKPTGGPGALQGAGVLASDNEDRAGKGLQNSDVGRSCG